MHVTAGSSSIVAFSLLICLSYVSSLPTDLKSPRAKVWQNALPEPLFELMESDCRAISAYERDQPSLLNNKKRTRWFPKDAEPRTALEVAIRYLEELANPDPQQYAGAEWWTQVVRGNEPIGFHVDKDESIASHKHRLVHAMWNSVFYLTDIGGGTLVTDQYSPSGSGYNPAQPMEAWWIFPKKNKFMVFNGTLLHGVTAGTGSPSRERITFLINFWNYKPEGPNCDYLDHDDVRGLGVLSKSEMRRLMKRMEKWEDEHGLGSRRRTPFRRVDLTPESSTSAYDFHMRLPGGASQTVRLPHEVAPGAHYHLLWDASLTRPQAESGSSQEGRRRGKRRANRSRKDDL